VYVTFWAVIIVFVTSALAGYALARIPFPGSRALFILFILSDAIPVFVVLIPLYILIQQIGLADSRWSLILTYASMKVGLSVFIMRGFFRSISTAMEDAAALDGCSLWQTIWHIMLPLIRPGALVVAILNFLSFWNEYFLAAVLLPNQDLFTLPAGLAAVFMGRYATNWPVLATGILISVIPSLAIFAVAQDKIVQGWTVSLK
jgi:ABC-type glycerol-3-phosphate transport system permease component